MNKTYVCVSIAYYGTNRISPDVHYYRDDGVHPAVSTWNTLTVAEANRLMWRLVQLGGKNRYISNRYNNALCERRVTFCGTL